MQKCLRMVTRTDNVINLLLENIDFHAAAANLIAPLIKFPVAFQ